MGCDFGFLQEVQYLYIKVRRNVNVADLVLQLESFAEERITDRASWRWGFQKTLHFNNSKAALAKVDRSLFDVSFKKQPISLRYEELFPRQLNSIHILVDFIC